MRVENHEFTNSVKLLGDYFVAALVNEVVLRYTLNTHMFPGIRVAWLILHHGKTDALYAVLVGLHFIVVRQFLSFDNWLLVTNLLNLKFLVFLFVLLFTLSQLCLLVHDFFKSIIRLIYILIGLGLYSSPLLFFLVMLLCLITVVHSRLISNFIILTRRELANLIRYI